ncbi:MAG: putative toxin-antitoxin system toxin component, PIN family [Proteobacteria bacterium]|nr:putative toxin-antitoxin system toxin component, PIN family [Pseudomonadota bacterium]
MKIVIDCNVLISAGLTNGLCREVLKQSLQQCEIFLSSEVILEYLLVSRREKFRAHQHYLEQLIEAIAQAANVIKPEVTSFKLPDFHDQKYIDLAISAKVDFLITGNLIDFPEKVYESVVVLSPRDYLNLLTSSC